MRTEDEGQRTIALNKRKFTNTTVIPRNPGKRQIKIKKRRFFLFPALQETVDASVLLEFMKIRPTSWRGDCRGNNNSGTEAKAKRIRCAP